MKLCVILPALVLGCSGVPPKVVSTVVDSVSLAVCILEHESEPLEQIAVDCKGATRDVVSDVLGAHNRAMARRRALVCGGGAP